MRQNKINQPYPGNVFTGTMPENSGPVILISRECGCSARRIAAKLSKLLSGYNYLSETKTEVNWRWISKENTREELREIGPHELTSVQEILHIEDQISETDVSQALQEKEKRNFDHNGHPEIIRRIIWRLIEKGHYIIVGMGAGGIIHDVPQKFSVRLQAPLDWRINRMMQVNNLSLKEAEKYVTTIDRQRDHFVQVVSGKQLQANDYDLVINYSTIQDDHIVDAIVSVLRNKHLLTEN